MLGVSQNLEERKKNGDRQTERRRIGPDLPLPATPMTFEFVLAVGIRTVLAFSPLGHLFQDDNQLSSPLTSYSRRKRLLPR